MTEIALVNSVAERVATWKKLVNVFKLLLCLLNKFDMFRQTRVVALASRIHTVNNCEVILLIV